MDAPEVSSYSYKVFFFILKPQTYGVTAQQLLNKPIIES